VHHVVASLHTAYLPESERMAVAAARDVVDPMLHGQLRGLVQSGLCRARLLGANKFQLETRACCAEVLTWQVRSATRWSQCSSLLPVETEKDFGDRSLSA